MSTNFRNAAGQHLVPGTYDRTTVTQRESGSTVLPVIAPQPPMGMPATLAPELVGLATCLSCHTDHATLSKGAVAAGADWRCGRCGQRWDARRLATVAAYTAWISARGSSPAGRVPSARG
jgi:hypothetical protein